LRFLRGLAKKKLRPGLDGRERGEREDVFPVARVQQAELTTRLFDDARGISNPSIVIMWFPAIAGVT